MSSFRNDKKVTGTSRALLKSVGNCTTNIKHYNNIFEALLAYTVPALLVMLVLILILVGLPVTLNMCFELGASEEISTFFMLVCMVTVISFIAKLLGTILDILYICSSNFRVQYDHRGFKKGVSQRAKEIVEGLKG